MALDITMRSCRHCGRDFSGHKRNKSEPATYCSITCVGLAKRKRLPPTVEVGIPKSEMYQAIKIERARLISEGGGVKKCKDCKKEKPLELFVVDKNICKPCQAILRKKNYMLNREKEIKRSVEWKRNNRDKARAFHSRWRKENPLNEEQRKRVAINSLRREYGERNYLAARALIELSRELSKESAMEILFPERKRRKKRIESGYWKKQYEKRKNSGYNEKRAAKERRIAANRRKKHRGSQAGDESSNR